MRILNVLVLARGFCTACTAPDWRGTHALRRSMLAGVAGQKPRRPQFVPKSFALRQAKSISHALTSIVMVGSRPGRGRSSSAAMAPFLLAANTEKMAR